MSGEVVQQKIGVMKKSRDDAAAGGYIGQQKTPRDGGGQPRRQDRTGVGVKRAGRRGVARVPGDAQGDQKNRGGGQRVGEPGAVAGQRADQRNGGSGRGGWR